MKQRDILALIDGVTPGIEASFWKAIAPFLVRLDAAEKRVAELEEARAIDLDAAVAAAVEKALAAQPKAPTAAEVAVLVPAPVVPTAEEVAVLVTPGKDADPDITRALVVDEVGKAVAAIPPVDLAPLHAAVNAANAAAAEATTMAAAYKQAIADLPKVPTAEEVRALIPTPENGKDADPEVIKAMVSDAVAALPPAEPGKDATPEQIAEAVEKALATWPKPKDGESVTVDQLQPFIEKEIASQMTEIPTPKDGVGLAGMLIDRGGELVATLTDGTTKKLGPVVGKDGDPGLGFDDIEMTDNGLTCTIAFKRGDQVKAFEFAKPTLADVWQGVWKAGPYRKGQAVTWGGSFWIAMVDTEAKPETNDDWKLAIKRGRDGKDLTHSEPKPPKPVKL